MLASSVRPGVAVVLLVLSAYVLVDVIVSPQGFRASAPFYFGQFVVLLIPFVLSSRWIRRSPVVVALGVDFAFTTLQIGHLTTDSTSVAGPAVTICMKLLGTALYFPWRPFDQALSSVATVALYQVGLWSGPRGALDPADVLPVAVFPLVTAVASVAGTVFADRRRRTLFLEHRRLEESQARLEQLLAAQQRDAAVKAALARVGRDLLSSVERHAVIDRVCQITAAVMLSDFSLLWLWDESEACFRPHGHAPPADPQWEEIRLLRARREEVAGMLALLEKDVAVFYREEEYVDAIPARLHRMRGLARCLFIPLERDGKVFGVLTAGYRRVERPLSEEDLAIARGIGQLASFSVENAQLFAELRRANELKGEFLATMSHELRSPLNAIVGYADLLRGGAFGDLDGEQQHPVERIHDNALHLLDLIVATLDVSRLEAGRQRLHAQPVSLGILVEEICRSLVHLREAQVALECSVPEDLPLAFVDPGAARAILQNFLSNALKYTRAGLVRIAAHAGRDAIEVHVRDSGIGIAPAQHHMVFEPYWQAHGGAGLQDGHGLGLYIVQQLAAAVGAQVGFTSREGEGSDFWVRFPVAVEPPTLTDA